jgi:hypothetical protein
MSVILKRPWTTQPQFPTGIDWGNPLTSSLRWAFGAYAGGKFIFDPARIGKSAFAVNAGTYGQSWGAAPAGMVITSSDTGVGADIAIRVGNATGSGSPTNAPSGSTGVSFTFHCGVRMVGAPSGNASLLWSAFAGGSGILIRINTSLQIEVVQPGVAILLTSSAISANVNVAITVTYNKNFLGIYLNGKLDTSSSSVGDVAWVTNQTAIFDWGAVGINGSQWWAPTAWSRTLGAGEVAAIYANPWQLFAPLPRRIWAPAAGAPPPPSGFAGARTHRMPHIGSRNG